MKINKSSTTKKVLLTSLVLALVAVGGYAAYAALYKNSSSASSDGINYKKPTSAQVEAGNNAKKQAVQNDSQSSSSTGSSSNPKVDSGNNTSQSNDLKTQITAASVEGNMLYVRNNINGIYQQGTCDITLTKDGKTVSKSAGVQALPQSSTCKGFNIPVSELSSGVWNITLRVTINGQSASDSRTVKV